MKIHAFNAGYMRPFGGRLWDGDTPGLGPARLACRCLLVERGDGYALVDTGFGLMDAADPSRIGAAMRLADRPTLEPDMAAITQIRRAGVDPREVRDIVMTHLDFDHAGGLSDFPWARVHVSAQEARSARARLGPKAQQRWRPQQIPAEMAEHIDAGPDWFGLPTLKGTPEGIRLVPLPGHSPGHCGVAIQAEEGWVLHAGDAVFMHAELEEEGRAPPLALAYEAAMQTDAAQRKASADRLRALRRGHGAEVTILCTHDPKMPGSPRVHDLGARTEPARHKAPAG